MFFYLLFVVAGFGLWVSGFGFRVYCSGFIVYYLLFADANPNHKS